MSTVNDMLPCVGLMDELALALRVCYSRILNLKFNLAAGSPTIST